jgi:hypothetical protein
VSPILSDEEVIGIVRGHIESKFPKECARCRRRYDSLANYLLETTHLGDPVTGDDPFKGTPPSRLVGTISYANCSCGSTLAISSSGLDLVTMWRLLRWAGASMSRRGVSMAEVLRDLRCRIDEEVLREFRAPTVARSFQASNLVHGREAGGRRHIGRLRGWVQRMRSRVPDDRA